MTCEGARFETKKSKTSNLLRRAAAHKGKNAQHRDCSRQLNTGVRAVLMLHKRGTGHLLAYLADPCWRFAYQSLHLAQSLWVFLEWTFCICRGVVGDTPGEYYAMFHMLENSLKENEHLQTLKWKR